MASGAHKKTDLLYVSNEGNDVVYVYSWPRTKLVGTLTGFVETAGECVDNAGDVWIVNEGESDILEYAHGGTSPIATLSDPENFPVDCSIDPTTGNLAVTNIENTRQGQGSVAIYRHAKGTPALYTDSGIYEYYFCGYDDKGNLYFDGKPSEGGGFQFAELPHGSKTFTNITLNQSIGFPGGVRWDGAHVAVGDQDAAVIYQFAISGSNGTEVGTTPLTGSNDVVGFWIERPKVIGPNAGSADVMIWKYPAGGTAIKTLYGQDTPVGATV
ncbi:MAG TPA: hypothetical protein VGI19_06465, partial [Candidatus Cybelea sp.]